jgi:hypothetical protein
LAQLAKLDQIGILVANSESVKATVDRLENIVVPRQELEARLRALEARQDS